MSNAGVSDPHVSFDGRYVAFRSTADNLVSDDTNTAVDIFVRDRQNGILRRINRSAEGIEANGGSNAPELSENGSFVVFISKASNLVPDDANNHDDIFVTTLSGQ